MVIETKIATNQNGIINKSNMAICPYCRQKLSEFVLVSGASWQRTRCRRCGYIIDVIASEDKAR